VKHGGEEFPAGEVACGAKNNEDKGSNWYYTACHANCIHL